MYALGQLRYVVQFFAHSGAARCVYPPCKEGAQHFYQYFAGALSPVTIVWTAPN